MRTQSFDGLRFERPGNQMVFVNRFTGKIVSAW